MLNAKTLAEFHFDTVRSGQILQSFLTESRISHRVAEKLLGYSYDTIADTLHGKNKDSKMEFVMKICAITGHTVSEWCDRMLEGVNDDVAKAVRTAFAPQSTATEQKPTVTPEVIIPMLLTLQADAIERNKDTLHEALDALQRQYEQRIAYLESENRNLIDKLSNR